MVDSRVGGLLPRSWKLTWPPRLGVCALAIAFAISFSFARHRPFYGMDSESIWFGSNGLLSNGDPYAGGIGHNPFVYPPSCALLFAPVAAVSNRGFVAGMLLLDLVGMVAIGVGCARLAGLPMKSWWSTIITVGLILSPLGLDSVAIGNASILVAALGLWSLLYAGEGRWAVAALLLGLAIAIKPIVVLFLLVFAARRAFRPLVAALAVVLVLNAGALLLVHDPINFAGSVIPKLLSGSLLPAEFNASIWATGAMLHAPSWVSDLTRGCVAFMGCACVRRHRRATDVAGMTCLSLGPTVAGFLVLRVDESHYNLLTLMLCAVLLARSRGVMRWSTAGATGVLLLSSIPAFGRWPTTLAQIVVLICVLLIRTESSKT